MKLRILRLCAALFLASSHFSLVAEVAAPGDKAPPIHPSRILVRLKDGVGINAATPRLEQEGMKVAFAYSLVPGLLLVDLPEEPAARAAGLDARGRVLKTIDRLRQTGLFRDVEPDYLVQASRTPDDARFVDGTLWGLRNTGQNGGVAGIDIRAERAWDLTTGSTEVVVAVIDTGIRYTHRDLAAQMWTNPDEIADNGIDDDHNGYVDDIHGINAIDGRGDPMDDGDHGSHCAGTIGAAANDGHGHVGVSWQVRLMACKFLTASGGGSTADAIKCIQYATQKRAKILSNSWGGGAFSQGLLDAILAARAQGILFVAAAGNDGLNTDVQATYPANYAADNILSVAAVDRQGKLATFSNYGLTSVHLGAPGVAIYSCTSASDTSYDTFQGTSMAAPHVSGVAALVLARFPQIGLYELKQRLAATTQPLNDLQGRTVTGGLVDAFEALNATEDGRMEISLGTATGPYVIAGTTASLFARVSDLWAVTNASVQAAVPGYTNVVLADTGVGADTVAGDGVYSSTLLIPTNLASLTVEVMARAPGKTDATNVFEFPILWPPPNDLFANAILLTGGTLSTTGTNRIASKEAGEPRHGGNAGGRSVWWRWTAPSNGVAVVETAGSSFDTTLGVYLGNTVSSLASLAQDDDTGPALTSSATFDAVAGETYQIAVDGYGGSEGTVALALRLGAADGNRPANDLFANRITLTGSSNTVDGTNIRATREAGEPMHADVPGGKSVWWTWTAPIEGVVTVTTDGSSYDTVLAVYTGDSVGALSSVASDDDGGEGTRSLVQFVGQAGTAYRIAVDGYEGATGGIRLTVEQTSVVPRPAHDDFTSRTTLSSGPVSVSGSNLGASREPAEPNHADNAGGRSVWWSWVAGSDGFVTIDTLGSTFDTLLAVYTGNSLLTVVPVASNDQDPAGGDTSRVTFTAVAGTDYKIVVDGANDGFGAESGTIRLSVSPSGVSPNPGNDHFATRSPLTGASPVASGSNVNATRETDEPDHDGYPGGRSLWWTWTAPSSGGVVVHTEGSSFDTLLAIYTGTTLAGLVPVESDDDDGAGVTSRVHFNAMAGTAYQIAVDGYNGDSGLISLALTLGQSFEPPANDDFAQRILLTGLPVAVSGHNLLATRETGEPQHAGVDTSASVWWTWTSPISGSVSLTTEGSAFDTVLAIYQGNELASLTPVASDDDSGPGLTSLITMNATQGATYQIAVSGYEGEDGEIVLQISGGGLAPSIVAHPQATSGQAGGRATFEVTTDGSPPLRFQWRKGGVDLVDGPRVTGVATRLLSISNLQPSDAGDYSVSITNPYGAVTSSPAHLTVTAGPGLGEAVEQPDWVWLTSGNQTWTVITDVTHDGTDAVRSGAISHEQVSRLQATVTGPGILSFWWKVSSELDYDLLSFTLDGFYLEAISGNVDWQEQLLAIPSGDHVVEWIYEKDDSLAEGADRGWLDQVGYRGLDGPPVIVGQPQGRTALVGDTVVLNVTAYGTAPLHYQWQKDGADVAGANGASHTLTNVQLADGGLYAVLVTNVLGSMTSVEVELIVQNAEVLGQALDAPALTWTTSGDGLWVVAEDFNHDGVDAARSGVIGHNAVSRLSTTVVGPGTLSFWWKVSSELDYDFLDFYMDGALLDSISGEVDWLNPTFAVDAGTHILEWEYSKDVSTIEGLDRAWVDEVRFTGAGPVALQAWSFGPGGFQFTVAGPAGGSLRVESTADFSRWNELQIIPDFTGLSTVIDASAGREGSRFYRVIRLP